MNRCSKPSAVYSTIDYSKLHEKASAAYRYALYKQMGRDREYHYASTLQDGGVGFDTMLIGFSLDLSALPKLSCSTDRTYMCPAEQPTMGVFVFRRVQEGSMITVREPAITRERKHFSKIHPSDCKPWTCLACSHLNWHEEVNAVLFSAMDR